MEEFHDVDRPIPPQPRVRRTPHRRQLGFRRILVPLDLSASTEHALRYAKAFAEKADAALDLLHVVQLNIAGEEQGIPRTNLISGLSETARHEMLKIIDKFLDGEAVTTVSVREGRPAEAILREAAATRADLIIMGWHSRSLWARLFRPGVLTRVLRRASCPVLVVPTAKD